MRKNYVSLDVDVFEKYFKVFQIEPLTEQKQLYILSTTVGNTEYSAMVSNFYAESLIKQQQEMLAEINSVGKFSEVEAV
ncbi:hypothetical protein [Lysinibacillus sp. LZ02]|uniref:hypothetical protein n=1 Tax=Lysinibacillus sp. LZ02 TaxID=3420668 RepID=UPI003D35C789